MPLFLPPSLPACPFKQADRSLFRIHDRRPTDKGKKEEDILLSRQSFKSFFFSLLWFTINISIRSDGCLLPVGPPASSQPSIQIAKSFLSERIENIILKKTTNGAAATKKKRMKEAKKSSVKNIIRCALPLPFFFNRI